MEELFNGYTLELPAGTFPLSTDSMVLSHFIRIPKNAKILDLGSGCGTLGLLLCAKDPVCTVTGVELSQIAHTAALENIRRNGLDARMHSICADLRTVNRLFAAGAFRCCVSNPPYYSGGPASGSAPLARRDDCCSTADLFKAAAFSLQYGGDFYLVHKPERLAQLCGCAVQVGLEPKRLCLVRHHPSGPVVMILLQCRKGGKTGLIWEEITLFDHSGAPTDIYKEIYHQ